MNKIRPHSALRPTPRVGFIFILSVALISVLCAGAWTRISRAVPQVDLDVIQQKRPQSVAGEILVRFRKDSLASGPRAQMSVRKGSRLIPLQVERLGPLELVEDLRLVRVAPEDTTNAIEALRKLPDVLYAEPNYRRYKEAVPNDPSYSQQWSLKNTGQSGGTPGADIKAEQAWDITTGSRSIVVGVVDEGIDINHSDLANNIWINPGEIADNGIDDDGNGYVDDVYGWDFVHNDKSVFDYALPTYPPPANYAFDVDDHGTHVAGTIGASGNNGLGVAGVNWQVSLMSLKFLGPDGGTSADLLKALAYAKTMKDLWISSGGTRGANLRVLNNSYGGGGFSQAELEAVRLLGSDGILFVVAAGNSGRSNDQFPVYPANYISTNLISVAASTRNNQQASFSNVGPGTVNIAAPGAGILSTTPDNTYTSLNGTSMATPHVTGAAALVCARYPDISVSRLRSALLYSGPIAPWTLGNSLLITSGRALDANAALQNVAVDDTNPPGAITQLAVTLSFYPNYRLQWTSPGDDGNAGQAAAYEVRYSENNLSDPAQFELATPLPAPPPSTAGNQLQFVDIRLPYHHSTGFIGVRVLDEVGNAGPIATLPITLDPNISDPYLMSESAAVPLSTGGTALGLISDESSKTVSLPFPLLGFGPSPVTNITVSTNGTLYFGYPPPGGDFRHSVSELNGTPVIAGLWDDLRTDRRAGDDVYVVRPDHDRIIFRWQAVTYDTPISHSVTRGENPVSFEVELRVDGSIQMRYGDGNHNLIPVVGLGGGWPDAYVVDSHTAETPYRDLTHASTVTFSRRLPTPPPTADITVFAVASPDAVPTGGQITYTINVGNRSYLTAPEFLVTNELPAGTSFVSCSAANPGSSGTCGPTAPGSRTITATTSTGTLQYTDSNLFVLTVVAQVNAPPGTILTDLASANSGWRDSVPENNNATLNTDVFESQFLSGVTDISCGTSHTLALKNDGSVVAWGKNWTGQLGNGGTVSSPTMVPVNSLNNAIAVAGGGAFSLALTSNGEVWAWGYNFSGQLGIGDSSSIQKTSPVRIPTLSGVTAIAAGGAHSLALKSDGSVWAWGLSNVGQLGTGIGSEYSPVQVPGLGNVIAIAAGDFHSLAVKADGTVWAWGDNSSRQVLGISNSGTVLTPTQVNGITDAVSVSAGSAHSVALTSSGIVRTWGTNAYGALGTGSSGSPQGVQQVINLSGVLTVKAGGYSNFAVTPDHLLWAWGENYGRFGNGTNYEGSPTPIQVTTLAEVQKLGNGANHAAAILADTTVRTWGFNADGELGDGTLLTRTSPVQVNANLIVLAPSLIGGGGGFTPINLTLECFTPGSTIHITTNGVDPTENDPIIACGGTYTVTHTMVLKVRAFRAGWIRSRVVTASYVLPPNPIDDARTFVRQHYLDFLGRQPDQGGWDYWTGLITQCGDNIGCVSTQRIGVSAAFFIELEFQQTGSVVYRFYRAAYGTMQNAPTRANLFYFDFYADRPLLVGGAGLPQNTINFANSFVQRSVFKSEYLDSMSNSDYVTKLFSKANLTGAANDALRQEQIDAMNTNGRTRAQVLLNVIEINEFKTREYNPSFVLMQYFAYLHRKPDQTGYDFWLNILNSRLPNDSNGYRSMVCAFITSAEYQFRFGISLSRSNSDCN